MVSPMRKKAKGKRTTKTGVSKSRARDRETMPRLAMKKKKARQEEARESRPMPPPPPLPVPKSISVQIEMRFENAALRAAMNNRYPCVDSGGLASSIRANVPCANIDRFLKLAWTPDDTPEMARRIAEYLGIAPEVVRPNMSPGTYGPMHGCNGAVVETLAIPVSHFVTGTEMRLGLSYQVRGSFERAQSTPADGRRDRDRAARVTGDDIDPPTDGG